MFPEGSQGVPPAALSLIPSPLGRDFAVTWAWPAAHAFGLSLSTLYFWSPSIQVLVPLSSTQTRQRSLPLERWPASYLLHSPTSLESCLCLLSLSPLRHRHCCDMASGQIAPPQTAITRQSWLPQSSLLLDCSLGFNVFLEALCSLGTPSPHFLFIGPPSGQASSVTSISSSSIRSVGAPQSSVFHLFLESAHPLPLLSRKATSSWPPSLAHWTSLTRLHYAHRGLCPPW